MRRNLSAGVEASPTIPVPCEILLPEVLWAVAVLGSGSTRTRGTQSPQGMWISEWNEGMPERIDGPYALDSQLFHAWKEQRGDVVEEVPWRDPDVETLETLASDHPEAQLLSPSQARRRGESLANRTLVVRLSAFIALVLVLAVVVRAPVWWMEHVLASTENRLASVRPQLDRLDRIRRQAGIDASFLDSSDAAFRPSASPGPLLDGMARRLGGGVRLQLLQIESPPGDTSWTMRTDARLDDWRGVASLVDSLRKVPGVADVHVETQQREKDKVHLVLSLKGNWP